MSESQLKAFMEECFTYDDELRRNGHFIGGEALQTPRNATTLRLQNGKEMITDGPYAETKEQLGGILLFEAKDLNHAIQLMSKHPRCAHRTFRSPAPRRGDKCDDSHEKPRREVVTDVLLHAVEK